MSHRSASQQANGASRMRGHRLRLLSLLLSLCWVSSAAAQAASAQATSDNQQTYLLSGSVVSSATGEPVSHALVRTNGMVQRSTFTDGEGHFQIEGMPATQVTITAQK